MADWERWHDPYGDPDSALSQRLRVVQGFVARALDDRPEGPVRVVSFCAGEGRDVIDVVARHPARDRVRARLVELTPSLADRARARAAAAGLPQVEVATRDAGTTDAFAGAVPADLVLACGVFGNVDDADVEGTVSALPMLCAAGADVVWTRGRRAPDLTPSIRGWFHDAGFEELAFESPGPDSFSVGMHRLVGDPLPFRQGQRLFTFTR